MLSRLQIVMLAAGLAAAAAGADATQLYSNNFETGFPESAWSSNALLTQSTPFTKFMGRYSMTDSVTLTLNAPSAAALQPGQSYQYNVKFDLYIIDSWDGYEPTYGEDRFMVYTNGTQIFNETFANQHNMQSFRAPDVGPAPMDFNSYSDSIYRGISLNFGAPGASTLSIKFRGQVMQGLTDESWGIDNVHVSYQIVPAPAGAAALGLAGLFMSRRRR